MSEDNSRLIKEITDRLIEDFKLKNRNVASIERIEIKEIEEEPRCIDVYDSRKECNIAIRIKYY